MCIHIDLVEVRVNTVCARKVGQPFSGGNSAHVGGWIMPKFQWFDAFDVGVAAIDDDHREMMKMLQQIQDAIYEQCLDSCKQLVSDFIDLTRVHFTTEEKILQDADFPQLRNHRVAHGQLLAQAIELEKFVHDASHIDDLKGCIDDLAGFLFHDLIGSDMEFKSYLQECGVAVQS